MSFPISPERIAAIIGAPVANVSANWPLVENHLAGASPLACVAAIATIRVECPSFKPQTEKYNGDPQEYFKKYDGRADLGNNQPGDGFKFRGRGFIQITGRSNYQNYGRALGLDLISNPDAVLEPNTSAAILAIYFRNRHILGAADARHWELVRKLVNGGLNGYADFIKYVNALLAEANI